MDYKLLYPDSHQHLGLFNDLSNLPNVELCVIGQKKPRNKFIRLIRNLHVGWTINKHLSLPFKSFWYNKPKITIDSDKEYCFIVMDGAVKGLNSKELNKIFSLSNVRGVLILINSMEASSIAILESKKKFKEVNWDEIYTFDFMDAKKYNYSYLGNCYYSKHDITKAYNDFPTEKKSCVYYTGGLKGGRKELILSVFERLDKNNIPTNFNLAITATQKFENNPYSNKINYYGGGWFPYERVLSGISQSKVILEVLQQGQNGPSLRYYEAVCYNKKLLTNNPAIVDLPYYDDRYMKIFRSPADIDIEWLKQDDEVNYNYKDDFSPVHLLNRVLV